MSNTENPTPLVDEINIKIVVEEDAMTTHLSYQLEGVPDESMPFMHAYMDGIMLLLTDTEAVAEKALETMRAAEAWAEVQKGKTHESSPELSDELPNNVLRLN